MLRFLHRMFTFWQERGGGVFKEGVDTPVHTILKAVKASINVPNVSYKSCTLLLYAKKKNIYTKYLFLFSKKFFPQTYLIWMPKLDVPKVDILLSKRP